MVNSILRQCAQLQPHSVRDSFVIPNIIMDSTIPKLLHQTYPSENLPAQIEDCVNTLRDKNPSWRYCFYDDEAIEQFIKKAYGSEMLRRYLTIDARYGAARADLFRYLLVYRLGGVYLDIKSAFLKPIDEVISGSEFFVISQWRNRPGEIDAGAGLHRELEQVPGGEFQQWHIIAVPGHPFLRAVLKRIIANLDAYTPWADGVGRHGVLRTTGPIAYTLAIAPILGLYPCKIIANEKQIGLEYSVCREGDHRDLFANHYSSLDSAIVIKRGYNHIASRLYLGLRRLKHLLRSIFGRK